MRRCAANLVVRLRYDVGMAGHGFRTGGGSRIRAELMRIYAAAVSAVEPRRVMARAIAGASPATMEVPAIIDRARGVYLLAVGKAALGMAAEARDRIGVRLRDTLAIAPGPLAKDTPSDFRVIAASHPLPDESSVAAGRAALDFAGLADDGDLLIVALSGGASAMMVAPADGIALADKIAIATALMRAGASIRELNAVRKHLSAIKGGQLLRAVHPRVTVLSLVLSDVPGDDLSTIGSGPTAADPFTWSDAIAVLKRRGLWGRAPEAVRAHLERGAAGEIDETVKGGDPVLSRARNIIVGSNETALEAAAKTASQMGYEVDRSHELSGDANVAGRALAAYICGIERPRTCVIAGGETVVKVSGGGRGGRSQQCALAMALELARNAAGRRIAAIFAGTDGIDGPTNAAGAFVSPHTIARSIEARADAEKCLVRNDSYAFFKALGDLIVTGPTGTNVADVFIALVNY
jgi:glycerate 2-kinase